MEGLDDVSACGGRQGTEHSPANSKCCMFVLADFWAVRGAALTLDSITIATMAKSEACKVIVTKRLGCSGCGLGNGWVRENKTICEIALLHHAKWVE